MKRFFTVIEATILVLVALLSSACAGGASVGDVNINNMLIRKIVEEQVRQRVTRIQGSLSNSQNNYYAEANVNAEGWADLVIKDPTPGAYSSYVFGQEYNEQLDRYITRLEGRSEVVIFKGDNQITSELTLSEWQDVVIKLPAQYTGNEKYFSVVFSINGGKYEQSFYPTSGGQYIIGMISLKSTSDVSVMFDGRKYNIPIDFFFGSIGENKPLPLNAFNSEKLTTVAIKASVMENYLEVPTEATTITAAMQYATAGMTILVKQGHYYESFTLKAGVRLMGDPTFPEGVIIESDQPFTVMAVGSGKYEIIGVTIRNTYGGVIGWNTSAVLFTSGADVRMRHSIVESTGTDHGIVAHSSPLQLANITFGGSGNNTPLLRFNNNPNEPLENLLFYNWGYGVKQANGSGTVKNSLFWQTPMPVSGDGSNINGDPMFIQQYNLGLRPNIDSPAVQKIMNGSGNYPGALRPEKNYDGKG